MIHSGSEWWLFTSYCNELQKKKDQARLGFLQDVFLQDAYQFFFIQRQKNWQK